MRCNRQLWANIPFFLLLADDLLASADTQKRCFYAGRRLKKKEVRLAVKKVRKLVLEVWMRHSKIHEGQENDGGGDAEVVAVARKQAFLRWNYLGEVHAKQQQPLGEYNLMAQFTARGGWVPLFVSTGR